jgi:hypothetical protein
MRRADCFKTISAVLLTVAISTSVQAGECMRLAAAGDGLTKDIAVVMSTHGLQNIIDGKGLKGQGSVKTTCTTGSIFTECRSSQLACK